MKSAAKFALMLNKVVGISEEISTKAEMLFLCKRLTIYLEIGDGEIVCKIINRRYFVNYPRGNLKLGGYNWF